MFWADRVAQELKGKPQRVDDGKTLSGRVHVGSLRGIVIHDVVYKALVAQKTKVEFSFIFDDFDAFDRVPAGLDEKVFSQYIGIPLSRIPSPDPTAENYGEFFANDFINVMTSLGVTPTILWQTKLHIDGILDGAIRIALDNAEKIQDIYQKVSGSKKREQGWLPFQPICEKCGKIGTTKATKWDGKEIEYECVPNLVTWAKGCGHRGKISPFGGTGKLPWKVYWPARWFALRTTIEGEGKDLASKGGARDVANHIAREVYHIEPPYDVPYEFFLYGGKKMSTSKGIGTPASEIIEILPPDIVRFLMLRSRPMQAINFNPTDPPTIPKLFDEYQAAAAAKGDDTARIFELSQIDKVKKPPKVRFSLLVQWVQMANMEGKIKKEGLSEWTRYARVWVENYAPEAEKFLIQETLPKSAKNLSSKQKAFLRKIASELEKDWEAETFQTSLYEWAKELNVPSKDAFAAIYLSLIGKDHGPKAAWLILSLDREFVRKRLQEAAK